VTAVVEAAMGVEMVEAAERVEEPAPVLLAVLVMAPGLLAALVMAPGVPGLAGPVMEAAGLVMEPAIAAAPPMPPLPRLMPLPLMLLPLMLLPLMLLPLTLPPPMPLPPMRRPWIIRPSTILP
jgi:hypothetical protein